MLELAAPPFPHLHPFLEVVQAGLADPLVAVVVGVGVVGVGVGVMVGGVVLIVEQMKLGGESAVLLQL